MHCLSLPSSPQWLVAWKLVAVKSLICDYPAFSNSCRMCYELAKDASKPMVIGLLMASTRYINIS